MDTIAAERWTFSDTLGADRLRALAEPPSFPDIVESIRGKMRVLCCHPEPCDIARGFERIIYCVKVERGLFDLFFNSRAGYRAAYYLSPYKGLEANTQAIDTLTPMLVASNATNGQRTNQFIEESLRSPSAKIWLAEPERGFCSLCSGEWSNPTDHNAEIMNERWECSSYDNAVKGRKAPFFEKLRIFGAFLNDGFDEIVPERKRHRAQHIHKWGWA
jgi:hypothetical protein